MMDILYVNSGDYHLRDKCVSRFGNNGKANLFWNIQPRKIHSKFSLGRCGRLIHHFNTNSKENPDRIEISPLALRNSTAFRGINIQKLDGHGGSCPET